MRPGAELTLPTHPARAIPNAGIGWLLRELLSREGGRTDMLSRLRALYDRHGNAVAVSPIASAVCVLRVVSVKAVRADSGRAKFRFAISVVNAPTGGH